MKKIATLVFFVVAVNSLKAQEATKFGLNCIYNDSVFNRLISSKNTKIVDFAQKFNISFLRFPGGTYERIYFWDRQDLIKVAAQQYADFLATNIKESTDIERNDQKVNNYGNKSDKNNPLLGDSLYPVFLKFCKKQSIMPIIQLNCWYYHDDKNVYKIANADLNTVENSKWTVILQNIKKQIEFAHKFTDQVYWEIGNEDQHFYSALLYANISAKYATLIKNLYPNDKVILTYANPESKKITANWNDDMINCLVKANSIKLVDFIAPHYYKAFDEEAALKTQSDLIKRIKTVDIYKKWQLIQASVSNYPGIKLFYTEFGIFKRVTNPNYNTQAHAMVMLYYLMNFNATPNVYGTIMHSFTSRSTAFLFDHSSFDYLNYNFTPNDALPDNFFQYVPPQAKAEKLFYENNPVKAQSLSFNGDYAYTVSNTGDKIIINILNFSDHTVNLKLSDIASYNVSSGKANISQYLFDDLKSHQWNYSANKQQSLKSGTLQVNKNSYSVITISK